MLPNSQEATVKIVQEILAEYAVPGNEIFDVSPVGDFMMSALAPSAYVTWLSFVAKDIVSLFTFCSSPPPIPKVTA